MIPYNGNKFSSNSVGSNYDVRKIINIFVTHQNNSSTRKNAGLGLLSTSRDDRSSKCVPAFKYNKEEAMIVV